MLLNLMSELSYLNSFVSKEGSLRLQHKGFHFFLWGEVQERWLINARSCVSHRSWIGAQNKSGNV